MDKTDFFLVCGIVVCVTIAGYCFGYDYVRKTVYQACETRQPLVIEMGGVKQVYACLRVQR